MSGPYPRPPRPRSADPLRRTWAPADPGQLDQLPVDEGVRIQAARPAGDAADPAGQHLSAHDRLRLQVRALQDLSAQLPFAPPHDRPATPPWLDPSEPTFGDYGSQVPPHEVPPHEVPTLEMALLEDDEGPPRPGRPRWRMPSPSFDDGRQGILEDIVTACTEGWRRAAVLSGGDGDVPDWFDDVAHHLESGQATGRRHLAGFAFAAAHALGLPGWVAETVGRGVVALAPLRPDVQVHLAPTMVRVMGGFLDNNNITGADGLVPPTLPHGTISRLADQIAAILAPLGEIPREKVGPRSRARDVAPIETSQVHLVLASLASLPAGRPPAPLRPPPPATPLPVTPAEGHKTFTAAIATDVGARAEARVEVDHRSPGTGPVPAISIVPPPPATSPRDHLVSSRGRARPAAPGAPPRDPFSAHRPGELSDDVAECLRRARSMRSERRLPNPR